MPGCAVVHLARQGGATGGNLIAALPSEKEVEADTADAESSGDLNAILLPGGSLPSHVRQFSVSYKQAAFEGCVTRTRTRSGLRLGRC